MADQLPMILLAVVFFAAVGAVGIWILSRWKTSRSPTRQIAPEVVTERYIQREARNADQNLR